MEFQRCQLLKMALYFTIADTLPTGFRPLLERSEVGKPRLPRKKVFTRWFRILLRLPPHIACFLRFCLKQTTHFSEEFLMCFHVVRCFQWVTR